ncbi:hypothetical protein [Nostoc sp. WHI]|nr:hypothetical protein [Nostoc sp. WHI]
MKTAVKPCFSMLVSKQEFLSFADKRGFEKDSRSAFYIITK